MKCFTKTLVEKSDDYTYEIHIVMGAGKSVFHEESNFEASVEMLQIFICSENADLELEFSSLRYSV